MEQKEELTSMCLSAAAPKVWPFSKHRALAHGGIHGGEERKVRVSKHSPSSAGILLSLLLRWEKNHPF